MVNQFSIVSRARQESSCQLLKCWSSVDRKLHTPFNTVQRTAHTVDNYADIRFRNIKGHESDTTRSPTAQIPK